MANLTFGGVPFKEAIKFYKDKVALPTGHWTDLWQGMHARAFVVAGATTEALVTDFHNAITSAISKGGTITDFRKDFDAIVARHGWTYRGARRWRSRVIFDTNIRMAHAAGKWDQIQRVKARRPYLRYVAVMDGRTRAQHKAWNGTVLPADDPFWKTHYPPNGWFCRCTVQQLSERDLKRFGHTVSDGPPPSRDVRHRINTPSGPVTVSAPEGIDPGFSYNVGEAAWGTQISNDAMAAWRAQGAKAWERLNPGDWRSAARPEKVPIDPPKKSLGPKVDTKAAFEREIIKALGGPEKIVKAADGSRVLINAQAFADHVNPARSSFAPMLVETLADPYEIWLNFERHRGTGKVQMRKRFIKIIDLPKGGNVIMVAQSTRGIFEAWTVIPSARAQQINKSRVGTLLWHRKQTN